MNKNLHKAVYGARALRKNMTKAESVLWLYLSNKGMIGQKFRRQHPVKGFVLDFYCPQHKLAIEIDGKIHDNQAKADAQRQKIIESKGIRFLRFRNSEVLGNIDQVLKSIKQKINPSPRSGEGCPEQSEGRGEECSK